MSALITTAKHRGKVIRMSLPPPVGTRVRLKVGGWGVGLAGTVERHRKLDPDIARDESGKGIGGFWCEVRLDEPVSHRAGPIEVVSFLFSWEIEAL